MHTFQDPLSTSTYGPRSWNQASTSHVKRKEDKRRMLNGKECASVCVCDRGGQREVGEVSGRRRRSEALHWVHLAPNGATSCPWAVVDIWQRCPDSFEPAAASARMWAFSNWQRSVYAGRLIKWIRRLQWWTSTPPNCTDILKGVNEKGRAGDITFT